MITAHLPSGYLLGKTLHAGTPIMMPAAIIGAVFPDFDLFWFYFVDARSFHHHLYWVHAPGFWLIISAVILPILAYWNKTVLKAYLFFVSGVFLHICLDTIAGSIMWLWPYSSQLF